MNVSGLSLILLLLVPALALAEPVTLYKPDDIARAKAQIERFEWAKSMLDGYRRQTAYVMAQDDGFCAALVPALTPWPEYGQSCPVCVGKQSSMGETGLWSWSIERPDEIVCKYCKTVFPNADYPETGVLEAPVMGQRFTYYLTPEERAHPEDLSGKYAFRWASWPVHTSFSGVIRNRRASWVAGQILPLAKVHALTGDPAYAARCLKALDAIATAFPNWLYHSYNGVYADCPPGEAAAEMGRHPKAGKFPLGVIRTAFPFLEDRNKDGFGELNNGFWGAGRMSPGAGGEGSYLFNYTVAYDLVKDAVDAAGQPLLRPEVKQRIEQDLILAGCADLENYPDINNKCGPGRALSGAVGILFGQPERVRRALNGFERLMSGAFHFDGFCVESPSYSGMHLGLMEDIPELLVGYSDPPGYQPKTGERFDDFDPFEQLPRYRLALESMVRMLAPNRKCPVIGDTHYTSGLSPRYAEILTAHYGPAYAPLLLAAQDASLADKGSEYALWKRDPELGKSVGQEPLPLRSEYFPGWQVAVLRAGGADSPTALYVNGYSMHGHRHYDTLGLIYYDHARELASDRGYIWDDPRNAWTKSTLSHNLVTVDGQNQVSKDRHSTLELFGTSPEVEITQSSANAYEQCDTYRRATALVRLSPERTYALDIFEVAGGKLHQYGLNCNGQLTGVTGLTPQPIDGKISYLDNLREAKPAPAGWRASWQDGKAGMQCLMLTSADRLLVADAPGWRSYKGDQLHAPPIQQLLAERAGENLSSRFVTILAPHQESPEPIEAKLVAEDATAVLVEVTTPGRRDLLAWSRDDAPHTLGPVQLTGRFGYVSLDDAGEVRASWLLAGTSLKYAGQTWTLPAARTAVAIEQVEGMSLTLAEPVQANAGGYLLCGGTGFEIATVDGRQVTVRDYPVPEIKQVEVLHGTWWRR